MSGARKAFLVTATAVAVGMALANDRRLAPVLAEASSIPRPGSASAAAAPLIRVFPDIRAGAARVLGAASLLGVAAIILVGLISAATAVTFDAAAGASSATYGPPAQLRAGAGIAGDWERSYAIAVPPADDIGGALYAAVQEQYAMDVLKAMRIIDEQRRAQAEAQASVRASGVPRTLNAPSGYAVGTVLRARITIYGCTGPGGGFCNNMASGMAVFEGAAACSGDLPFGSKVQIIGDPTGRTYECLDRGALPATWIDVYFHNTSDGMAWQGLLGGTVADIIIVN